MEEISIFQNKEEKPTEKDLTERLGTTWEFWIQLRNFIIDKYPYRLEEWNYSGKKYGWSFRIKDKKRAIIYFLPRDNYFKVAFVFGQKASEKIIESDITTKIKKEIEQAPKYAEGRGIRIEIKNGILIPDIKKLIEIKLAN